MDESLYKNLARVLVSRIGQRHYFNGSVCSDSQEIHLTLRASLIIYREALAGPDCTAGASHIKDIVPVWWEFEQIDAEGNISADFSWSEFRPFLLEAV